MNIKLLACPDLAIARYAGRVCTATEDIEDDPQTFIEKLIKAGHESVLEHLNYTFEIRDITRGLLQELARHRHVSMSVQSTRWALKRTLDNQIGKNASRPDNALNSAYRAVFEAIKVEMGNGATNDELKSYLPEGFETSLILTTNARELRHILKIRSAPNAYREFRELCAEMFYAIPEGHKFMFSDCMYNHNVVKENDNG